MAASLANSGIKVLGTERQGFGLQRQIARMLVSTGSHFPAARNTSGSIRNFHCRIFESEHRLPRLAKGQRCALGRPASPKAKGGFERDVIWGSLRQSRQLRPGSRPSATADLASEGCREGLRRLTARDRATVRTALETHLRHKPEKVSRSHGVRLEGYRERLPVPAVTGSARPPPPRRPSGRLRSAARP